MKKKCSFVDFSKSTLKLVVKIWVIVVLITASQAVFSQTISFKLNSLTTDEGLPSDNVEYLFQDSFGFLWIANFDGLTKYDGHTFKHYVHVDTDSTSISNNVISCIFEDSQHRLWIATQNGLNFYNRQQDSFELVQLKHSEENVPVKCIVEDTKKNIWLGTSFGLCRVEPASKHVKWFYSTNLNKSASDAVFSLVIDRKGLFWLGTFGGGLIRFNAKTNTFTNFPTASQKIHTIAIDNNQNIWVGSFEQGIFVLDKDGKLIKHLHEILDESGKTLKLDLINSFYQDKSDIWWIGVHNAPAYFVKKGTFDLVPMHQKPYKKTDRFCRSITAFCEDSFGNLWFGSREHGLFYTNHNKNNFVHIYKNSGDSPQNLPHNIVSTFLEDKAGNVWAGTQGGGIAKYNARLKLQSVITTNNGLSSNAIMDLIQDNTGDIWVATWNGGLVQLDKQGQKKHVFLHQNGIKNSLPYNNLKALLVVDSVLWIGTHGEGLALYDLKNKQFVQDKLPFNPKIPAWINHIFQDSKHRIWISTYGGLFLFDRKKLHKFTHNNYYNSLSSSEVNMVTEDTQHQIWVACESGGISHFLESTTSFQRFGSTQQFPNTVKGIISTGKYDLWLSSNEGLYHVNTLQNKLVHYDISDGLQGNSFFLKSVLKSKKGYLYFGGTNGFSAFHTDSIRRKYTKSPFYFTDLMIYNQEQKNGNTMLPIKKIVFQQDTVILQPSESFFTLNFTAINLYAPSQIRYAYRLEGLQKEWIPTTNETKATFTDLAAGTYTFKVQYTGGDGIWHASPKNLTIIMLPPWWKTWWFKSLLWLSGIGSIVGFFYWRLFSIQQQNRTLEAQVVKRTHQLTQANQALQLINTEVKQKNQRLEEYNLEIQRQTDTILVQQSQIVAQNQTLADKVEQLAALNTTKDRFFSILAHDLKNPIHALLGHTMVLKNKIFQLGKEELASIANHLYNSSNSVNELLINLLDWARTQSKHLRANPETVICHVIFQKNMALFNLQLKQKNIEIKLDVPNHHAVIADSQMLDAILRNLLSNCIKFTPINGKILINAECKNEKIILRIQDNGIGMNALQLERVFHLDKPFYSKGTEGEPGTGLGLVIVQEFLQLNQGTIHIESNEGEGCTFIITLPKSVSTISNESIVLPTFINEVNLDGLIGDYRFNEDDFSQQIVKKFEHSLKNKRILIVDDSPELRAHIRWILADFVEIIEAENGREGFEKASEYQPDIIISDFRMPELDGIGFCKLLKKSTPTSHIPIILLTSQDDSDSQLLGYEAGADAYLAKPIRQEVLLQILHNFIINTQLIKQRIHLASELNWDDVTSNSSDIQFMTDITQFVEDNLTNQALDAEQIIIHTALSRTVLYAKMKAITGLGVHEFIRTLRLKKSIKLLLEGELNVSQIAYEVGFNSPSYYVRSFTKQYGNSPKEYLKKLLLDK